MRSITKNIATENLGEWYFDVSRKYGDVMVF
jgi:hypothetical protein